MLIFGPEENLEATLVAARDSIIVATRVCALKSLDLVTARVSVVATLAEFSGVDIVTCWPALLVEFDGSAGTGLRPGSISKSVAGILVRLSWARGSAGTDVSPELLISVNDGDPAGVQVPAGAVGMLGDGEASTDDVVEGKEGAKVSL